MQKYSFEQLHKVARANKRFLQGMEQVEDKKRMEKQISFRKGDEGVTEYLIGKNEQPRQVCVCFDQKPIEFGPNSRPINKTEKETNNFLEFISDLSSLFNQTDFTEEDKKRTELYKKRAKNIAPRVSSEKSLSSFLLSLKMKLVVKKIVNSNFDRAIQLINKTNQFNMNGVKQTYDSVSSIIESGGSIFTASLYDISGGHGEILVCLIDNKGVIRSFAMSCRVFQRKIEYVFIYWLHKYINFEKFNYMKTDRNGVFQEFINEDIFINKNDSIRINNKSLTIANKKYNNLVDLSTNF